MQRLLLYFAIFVLGLSYGCKDCEPVPNPVYHAKLIVYDYDSVSAGRGLVLFADTISTLVTEGLPNPIYSNQNPSTTALELPLSNQATSVNFVFNWKNRSEQASIELGYQRLATPVPPDCGVYDVYEDLAVVQHNFDSVSVLKSVLELGDEVHIHIFLSGE